MAAASSPVTWSEPKLSLALLDLIRLFSGQIPRNGGKMEEYRTKLIDYEHKTKVVVYDRPVKTGTKNEKNRTKYENMGEIQKKEADKRRIKYYKKVSNELIELAMMNDFSVMVTLTFAENLTDYDRARTYFENFLHRFRKHLSRNGEPALKFICVWERQKRGAIHFHALFNCRIEHKTLERLWGHGFVFVSRISSSEGKLSAIKYIVKYMTKSVEEQLKNGMKSRQRLFFASNNLEKPEVKKLEEALNLDDLIFDNMENMISTGEYDLADFKGLKINHAEFLEYKS